MKINRPHVFAVFALCLGATLVLANEPVTPGTARADVIAKYGTPVGEVNLGAKAVLTYPEGRVVLVNGVVKSFEPAKTDQQEPRNRGASVSVVSGANGKWLTDPGVAKEQAAAQGKRILFLLTGDMSRCPSGARFNQEIAGNSSFSRMMSSEYVLLQIDVGTVGNSPDTAVEAGSAETRKMQEKLDLMTGVFPDNVLPAMAILSADLKHSAVVDLSGPTSVAGYNNMLSGTIHAVNAVKESPMTATKLANKGTRKFNFSCLAIAALALGWVVKRFC